MADTNRMTAAARDAMIHVLDLVPGDQVLVVTDETMREIGRAFAQAAGDHGCGVRIYALPADRRPLTDPPAEMIEMLAGITVVINVFQAMGEETPFRMKWIFAIEATKRIRLGHAPGLTEAMMTEGPMSVDYAAMARQARALIEGFRDAVSVRITAPGGTDVTLVIEDRAFLSDVKSTVEAGSNLPCGEIYCAPVETAADGVLVIDGSIGDVGRVTEPLRITLVAGRIVKLECADAKLLARIEELTGLDKEARVIGELGIGLNPGAKLTGNLLEDEKAFRTAHIAFGNNAEFPGGRNRSQTHRDFLFYRPTFEVVRQDGSSRILIRDGEFQL
jgi:aminopeptidase